jgi:hypothetical protein
LTYGPEAWKNNHGSKECARNILTKILKKIYGQVEEDERWKIKKKEIKDILQGADIVKFINSPSDFDCMAMLKGCKSNESQHKL